MHNEGCQQNIQVVWSQIPFPPIRDELLDKQMVVELVELSYVCQANTSLKGYKINK